MKKKLVIAGILMLCIVLIVVLWPTHRINAKQVESISAGGQHSSQQDIKKFVKLFNAAKYKGKDVGYGTTPEWVVGVHFIGGNYILLHRYGNYNFLIVHYVDGKQTDETYFINSQKLYEFILELQER